MRYLFDFVPVSGGTAGLPIGSPDRRAT